MLDHEKSSLAESTQEILAEDSLPAVSPPIMINPSAVPDQARSLATDVVLVIGGLITITGFLQKKDLFGFLYWVQSSEALPFVSLVAVAVVGTFRQLRVRKRVAERVVLGLNVDDSIGQVIKKVL